MKKSSLTRSIPFWLLLALSLVSAAVGGWIIFDQTTTMSTALLAGTATGVEVYVGQPLIVVGAALLGAGIIGILLVLGLGAAKALVPAAAPVVVEPIDWTAEDPEDATTSTEVIADETDASTGSATETAETAAAPESETDDQNGSSGSTATATKISVR